MDPITGGSFQPRSHTRPPTHTPGYSNSFPPANSPSHRRTVQQPGHPYPRPVPNPNPNSHTNTNPNSNSYPDADADADPYSYSYPHSSAYTDAYPDP
jgi:hypothetical protein